MPLIVPSSSRSRSTGSTYSFSIKHEHSRQLVEQVVGALGRGSRSRELAGQRSAGKSGNGEQGKPKELLTGRHGREVIALRLRQKGVGARARAGPVRLETPDFCSGSALIRSPCGC